MKRRAETNELEKRKTTEKLNETRSYFFENINKINKLLVRLIGKKGEETQMANISNKRGGSSIDSTILKRK